MQPADAAAIAREREIMNFYAPHFRTFHLFNSLLYEQERKGLAHWILQMLRRAGADVTRLSFLEAGTSTGNVLEHFAAAGCRTLTGLDVAEEMVAEARKHVPAARFIHGAIETHDFGGETFDVVIASFTLHHMPEPRAFFEMVDRVLKPGGWVFVADYNGTGWGNAGWTRTVIELLVAPLRRLIKIKNRRWLKSQHDVPLLFNPAHRLLSHDDIRRAIPHPDAYQWSRSTQGLLTLAFNYALVPQSRLDRAIFRLFSVIDLVVKPFRAGGFQCLVGRRHA